MKRFAIALLIAIMLPSVALATPGDVGWVQQGTTDARTFVDPGGVVEIQFAAGSNDSTLMRINAVVGELCFLPNSLAAGGSARIALYKAVLKTPTDTS